MGRAETVKQLFQFLSRNGKYWLAPIIIILILLGLLAIFTEGSVLAPFIYSLF